MAETHERNEVHLHRSGSAGLLIGAICLIVVIAMMIMGDHTIWQSYLWAFVLCSAITLGCFGLTLLHHTVEGRWGLPVLRILEAGGGRNAFILLAVLFIPIVAMVLLNRPVLYEWVDPNVLATDHVIHHKAAYLNPAFFAIRAVLFFALWMGLAAFMRASVFRQEKTGNANEQNRRRSWAAPGLVAFVISITFAFTDWVMSLEPHWFSTIYGVWFLAGMTLMALAFVTIIVTTNAGKAPYNRVVSPALTRDLGNLMLAFTMLWAYTSLSQYLIIWSGNLPEFTPYYVRRSEFGWNAIGMAILLGSFFIPFLMLLIPRVKAQPKLLARIAGWIIVMRILDSYYVVMPAFNAHPVHGIRTPMPALQDFLALAAVAGLWFWVFASSFRGVPLLPTYDPRLTEADAHAH